MFPPWAPFFVCSRPGASLLRGSKFRSATRGSFTVARAGIVRSMPLALALTTGSLAAAALSIAYALAHR